MSPARTRTVLLAVAGVAAATWLVLATGGAPAPAAPTGVDPEPALPAPAVPADGDPVAHATAYLQSRPPVETDKAAILLDLLGRAHDQGWVAPYVDHARWAALRPFDVQDALYARVFDPGAAVTTSPEALAGPKYDKLTAPALHCDRWPLPEDWSEDVADLAAGRRIADRTHALIAVIWAHEHGCIGDAEYLERRDRIADTLVASLRQQQVVDDQFVEAVALLAHVGRDDLVDPGWVRAIREAQRTDGGWEEEAGAGVSSWHTTMLGLWVLLQQRDGAAGEGDWIRDP